MKFNVEQSGNVVSVRGGDLSISYEVSGIQLPKLTDLSFAVWHLVPQAMMSGSPIHINGTVDPLVIRHAEQLSRIWELWAPAAFREVKITAAEVRLPSRRARGRDVVFYSGGVDSTYYLLSRGHRARGGHVLMMHGTDYKFDDVDRFAALFRKTASFLESLNYKRVVIRTNVLQYSKLASMTHGFIMAGCAFLLNDLFDTALLAADYTWEQDMLSFPWGTNHITNRYLAGTDFRLETCTAEWSRTEKVAAIAQSAVACDAVSFCVNYAMRPDNCGKCAKCVRTKAMFIATTGASPDIFLDGSLVEADLQAINLTDRKEYAFFSDLFLQARNRGTLDKIPGLETLMLDFRATLPAPKREN